VWNSKDSEKKSQQQFGKDVAFFAIVPVTIGTQLLTSSYFICEYRQDGKTALHLPHASFSLQIPVNAFSAATRRRGASRENPA
jgi:hypothetical protein